MDHWDARTSQVENMAGGKGQPQMQMHPACLSQPGEGRGGEGEGGTRGGDEREVGTGACDVRSDSSMAGMVAHSDGCV